jgi:hypothetical protein
MSQAASVSSELARMKALSRSEFTAQLSGISKVELFCHFADLHIETTARRSVQAHAVT